MKHPLVPSAGTGRIQASFNKMRDRLLQMLLHRFFNGFRLSLPSGATGPEVVFFTSSHAFWQAGLQWHDPLLPFMVAPATVFDDGSLIASRCLRCPGFDGSPAEDQQQGGADA